MAKERFLVSTKKPGLEFKVIGREIIDPDKQEMKLHLLGAHGVEFDRVVSPEILKEYGYVIDIRDDSPAPQG